MAIYLTAEESPAFFLRYQSDLRNCKKLIASNNEVEIWISATKDGRMPEITITKDNNCVDKFRIPHVSMLCPVVRDTYKRYQVGCYNSLISDRVSEISDREEELDNAVIDFFDTVFGNNNDMTYTEDIINDCKNHFLEYIYQNYECEIYRPMYLSNGDDAETLTFYEYPYGYIFEN